MIRREMTNPEIDELIDSQPAPALPADRLKQIETAVTADLKPVRPLAPDSAYLAGLLGIFLIACIAGCFIGPHGWHVLSGLQKVTVLVPLAATTALVAFSVVRQMRPAAKHARSSALVSAGVFVVLLLIMMVVFQPAQESAFLRHGLACFRTGMVFAIPAAFFLALLLLRGAPLSPLLTGATAGGFAGLVGLTVLEIHCPILNVYHIIFWHVSVTLACIVAGIVFSSVTFWRWPSNR